MSTVVHTVSLLGITGIPVQAEIDILDRLPSVVIIGLPGAAVRETGERVRYAIQSLDLEMPRKRICINLAPADLHKPGCGFDLPIAVGILVASGQLAPSHVKGTAYLGELSLDGTLRPIRGCLPLVLAARKAGMTRVVIPEESGPEVAHVQGLEVLTARTLGDVVRGRLALPGAPVRTPGAPPLDMAELPADLPARRALEVAAVGGLSLLLVGSPGCGKAMFAARLPGILPEMTTQDEREQTTCIQSAAGLLGPGAGLVSARPFRAPHHTIGAAGMIGNAAMQPGEILLAHHGVLLLDELPEYGRHVAELVSGVLRDGAVTLHRAAGSIRFPCAPLVVGAMNPCPCGYQGHPTRTCTCDPELIARYRERVTSFRLHFDMRIPLAPLPLERHTGGEDSATIRARVTAARALLASRQPDPLWPDTVQMRIARSIAALAGRLEVTESDMEEAATYLDVV